MKKLFTSVMAALCLAAPVGTLSAQQTQLTEAQKEAFKKEVLPVVFEQIKEQAGIDILGWANPQLSNTFAGIPVLESSSLRATTTDPMTVHPDSIVVDLASLGLKTEDIPLVGSMIGDEITIGFEGYETKTLPLITAGTHPITIDLPQTINVKGAAGTLASVKFESPEGSTKLIDVNVSLSLLGGDPDDLLSCSLEQNETTDLVANVDIKDYLRTLAQAAAGIFGGENSASILEGLEPDYQITVGLSGLATGTIPATLYAVPENITGTLVPVGNAVVHLNMLNTMMPVEQIDVTGYKENATVYSVLYLNMTKTESSASTVSSLVVDNWKYGSEAKTDSTLTSKTFITMTDKTASIPTTPEAAVKNVIDRVVAQLAEDGEASWYELSIAQTGNKDIETAEDATPVVDITVSPYTGGESEAIADIDITTYKNGEAAGTYTVRATANYTSQVIAVDVMNGETKYGTAYFTSNAMDIITANEDIATEAAAIRIIPTDNGVRVLNVDRAEYQIVSMTGSTVARGVVSGDETISTANLPKGIYVIAVDQNGDREVVKFVR